MIQTLLFLRSATPKLPVYRFIPRSALPTHTPHLDILVYATNVFFSSVQYRKPLIQMSSLTLLQSFITLPFNDTLPSILPLFATRSGRIRFSLATPFPFCYSDPRTLEFHFSINKATGLRSSYIAFKPTNSVSSPIVLSNNVRS